jgi:lysophospholipase L1-like esterase
MSKKHWAALAGIAILQICLLISVQTVAGFLSPSRIIALAVIESTLILMVISAFTGKFASLSITLWLLLLVNFAITPVDFKRSPSGFLTLPSNLDYRLEVIGDGMPGFTGVQHISTDALGFRTTKKIDYQNKGNTYRVFTIGGSTTEEIYTDDQKTWSALLEGQLTKTIGRDVEVINTGFAGLRAPHHYKTLEHILRYKPDAAIFLMGINDWNHHIKAAIRAQEITQDKAAKDAGQPAIQRSSQQSTDIFQAFDLTKSILWKSIQRVIGKKIVIKNDGSYYYNQNHSVTRQDWRRLEIDDVTVEYSDSVTQIISLCKQASIRCLFVNQPNAYQPNISADLTRRLWMTPPKQSYSVDFADMRRIASTYNKWLLQRAPDNSCDLSTALTATTDHLIDDCHFNPRGSAIVANQIYQCFVNQLNSK